MVGNGRRPGEARGAVVSHLRSYILDGERGTGRNMAMRKGAETRSVLGNLEVSRKVQAEKEFGLSAGTRRINLSHWSYWRRFREVWRVDAVTFGSLGENTEGDMGLDCCRIWMCSQRSRPS